jgi:nitrate reductase NapE
MDEPSNKRSEWRAFILLVVFFAPVMSVGIVGGYGLLVWISQLVLGPPGV